MVWDWFHLEVFIQPPYLERSEYKYGDDKKIVWLWLSYNERRPYHMVVKEKIKVPLVTIRKIILARKKPAIDVDINLFYTIKTPHV